MYTYISMLRGINVSGQKKIRMVDLQSLYESLELKHVKTYVQSGNVVFESKNSDASTLTALIEGQIQQVFGYDVAVFLRQPHDFQRIIANNPFLKRENVDVASLYVTFLYRPVTDVILESLKAPDAGLDGFAFGAQEIYLFCPKGYGRTKLNNTFFEKKLGQPATTRNWNTVNALLSLTPSPAQ